VDGILGPNTFYVLASIAKDQQVTFDGLVDETLLDKMISICSGASSTVDVNTSTADANTSVADADKAKADVDKAKADADKAKADVDKAKADVDKAKADADKAKADAEKAKLSQITLESLKKDRPALRYTLDKLGVNPSNQSDVLVLVPS